MWRKIQENIRSQNQKFILGVSGGMDSMFMLDFVRKMKDIDFCVAHFNHKDHSMADHMQNLVEEYCSENGIKIFIKSGIHENLGKGFEDQDRKQRYAFFDEIVKNSVYKRVMTCHHWNDQVETILFRLTRGYKHDNLMMKSENAYRPFLEVEKEEIIKSVVARNIPYMEDPTNRKNDYDRNFLRNEVIPLLTKRFNAVKAMKNGI